MKQPAGAIWLLLFLHDLRVIKRHVKFLLVASSSNSKMKQRWWTTEDGVMNLGDILAQDGDLAGAQDGDHCVKKRPYHITLSMPVMLILFMHILCCLVRR